MSKMSPTSMKVTLRQLREGRKLNTLHECLEMEYRWPVNPGVQCYDLLFWQFFGKRMVFTYKNIEMISYFKKKVVD
jgi:hypothetical protein